MVYRRQDLVALIFAPNECYTQVVRLNDEVLRKEEVTVDEEAGTWSCPENHIAPAQVKKIGESISKGQGRRIIGIYDSTKIEQLTSMAHAIGEAIREDNHGDD